MSINKLARRDAWFNNAVNEARKRPDYITETMLLDITGQICETLGYDEASKILQEAGWSKRKVYNFFACYHSTPISRIGEVLSILKLIRVKIVVAKESDDE